MLSRSSRAGKHGEAAGLAAGVAPGAEERGLPSLREAVEQGMSVAQWNAMLKEAGVWD